MEQHFAKLLSHCKSCGKLFIQLQPDIFTMQRQDDLSQIEGVRKANRDGDVFYNDTPD